MDAAAARHPDVDYQPVLIDATYAGLITGAADDAAGDPGAEPRRRLPVGPRAADVRLDRRRRVGAAGLRRRLRRRGRDGRGAARHRAVAAGQGPRQPDGDAARLRRGAALRRRRRATPAPSAPRARSTRACWRRPPPASRPSTSAATPRPPSSPTRSSSRSAPRSTSGRRSARGPGQPCKIGCRSGLPSGPLPSLANTCSPPTPPATTWRLKLERAADVAVAFATLESITSVRELLGREPAAPAPHAPPRPSRCSPSCAPVAPASSPPAPAACTTAPAKRTRARAAHRTNA